MEIYENTKHVMAQNSLRLLDEMFCMLQLFRMLSVDLQKQPMILCMSTRHHLEVAALNQAEFRMTSN